MGTIDAWVEKTEEAAAIVKVSKSFLHHRWREIPGTMRAGRALRFDIKKLLEWMRQNAANSNGQVKEK